MTLSALIGVGEPDIELINLQLERYGRSLYLAGRPYGHYSETINGVASRRPRIKRMLQPAWDLAYSWLRQEPPTHHLALPWQGAFEFAGNRIVLGVDQRSGHFGPFLGRPDKDRRSHLRCQAPAGFAT